MIIVTLRRGDSINIQFDEDDGEFEVHYDTFNHPDSILVKETAELNGSVRGIGGTVLYHEEFDEEPPPGVQAIYLEPRDVVKPNNEQKLIKMAQGVLKKVECADAQILAIEAEKMANLVLEIFKKDDNRKSELDNDK